MSAMIAALGLAAAGLAALAVWLWVGKERLRTESRAEAEAKAAAAARVAELSQILAAESEGRREAEDRALSLRSDLERANDRHSLEMRNQASLHRQEMEAMEGAHGAEKAHERELLAVRERSLAERIAQFDKMRDEFKAAFGDLAGTALSKTSEDFLRLAGERQKAVEGLLAPIREQLDRTGQTLTQFKQERAQADARLETEIKTVSQIGSELRANTADLVQLLQSPKALGQYGETQLKRVAEFAGMREYCDFEEQVPVVDADGDRYRPDMVVKLPQNRRLVVDAKASLIAIGQAAQCAASDEEREACLEQFAENVLSRVNELGKKNYWQFFDGSPQMVVLFLPGEQFLDAAFRRKPQIIELAAARNVVIASPSSLIALIRGVAMAWRQEALAEEWAKLRALGAELHNRVEVVLGHALGLGKALNDAGKCYDRFIASAERNLLTTARRFEKFDVKSGKVLPKAKDMEGLHLAVQLPRHGVEGEMVEEEAAGAKPGEP